jgi:hypothetical protein
VRVVPITNLKVSAKALRDMPATDAIFVSDQSSPGE